MRVSPKLLLAVLYLFFVIMLAEDVLAQMPINEATEPYIVLAVALIVFGLALILAWDYIIPMIFRNYRLGECKVVDQKYIICRYKTGAELVGYAGVKVVPTQPIGDMPKERRDSYLQAIQGLLAGAQFEVVVAYVGMKDRYRETIIERLKSQKQRLLSLATKPTPAVSDTLNRIDAELKVLEQVPMILEGFYVAFARDYGMDEYELLQKLEGDLRVLVGMLSGRIGAKAMELKGEELREIVSYLMFGSVVQMSL